MLVDDFLSKGYYTDFFPSDLANEFNDKEFSDCNQVENLNIDPDTQSRLEEIHRYFLREYVLKLFPNAEMKNNGMWHGVDNGSAVWHNDQEDGDPFNSNILVYIDDNVCYNNSIEVTNGIDEYKIVPKPNQFVWLNQRKIFKHRATHNQGPRRLLSFEFYIDGLNY